MEGVRTDAADILNLGLLQKTIDEFSPQIIVHAAALADVDLCEKDKDRASKVNALGTRNLVRAIKDPRLQLIYISTDMVYDGLKGQFSETDAIGPRNHYAVTKWEGEEAVIHGYGKALVLRTNFFGWNIHAKRSLAQWLLDELSSGHAIKGYTDAIFSSLYTFDMAQVIGAMIDAGLSGIYNLGSRTFLSKYEFLVRLANRIGLNPAMIKPVEIMDTAGGALRSKNLSMDVSKLMRDVQVSIPTLEECIEHFISDMDKKSEFIKMTAKV